MASTVLPKAGVEQQTANGLSAEQNIRQYEQACTTPAAIGFLHHFSNQEKQG